MSTLKIWLVLFVFHQFLNSVRSLKISPSNGFPDALNVLADRIRVQQIVANSKYLHEHGPSSLKKMFDFNPNLIREYKAKLNKNQCGTDIIEVIAAIFEAEYWALAMVDSFGKIGSGILDGNFIWPGSYSECRQIQPISLDKTKLNFSGQYCWADFQLGEAIMNHSWIPSSPYPIVLQTAMCFPSSCSAEELMDALSEIFYSVSSIVKLADVQCLPKSVDVWNDKRAVVCFAIICIFLVLLIVGTLCDIFYYQKTYFTSFKYTSSLNSSKEEDPELNENMESSEIDKQTNSDSIANGDNTMRVISSQDVRIGIFGAFLLSFSVYTNGAKILSLSPGNETLKPINGIRFLSMTWIIMGHTFLIGCLILDNSRVLLDVMKTFVVQFILQGMFAVDSFFVISGLLVAYLFLKEYEYTNGKIRWLLFYIHRYWRLTPLYILVMMLLRNSLNRYFSDGPFWPLGGFEGDNCSKNWWWNILYINNFIPIKDMCMGQSWYLANDMQFYILSPLLLIPLAKRSAILTSIIAGSLILLSIISSGVLSSHYNISAVIDLTKVAPNTQDYNKLFDVLYDKPYCRIGPYVIGMICGWLLYTTKCKIEMNKYLVTLGWLLALACNLSVMFGLYHSNPSQAVSSLYFALSRIGWSLGLSWLIFACCTGYGGFVNTFLSWPVWNPFSRLSYSVYLIHIMIIQSFFYSSDVVGHFSYTVLIFYYLSFVTVSYLCGLVISLAFEAPFLSLEKLIYTRRPNN